MTLKQLNDIITGFPERCYMVFLTSHILKSLEKFGPRSQMAEVDILKNGMMIQLLIVKLLHSKLLDGNQMYIM